MNKDFLAILKDIKQKNYKPVYLLHGDNAFYKDKIVNSIEKNVLSETEKDFNLDILYANETTPDQILGYCRQLPMFAEKRVVIVKEAQHFRNLDFINQYCQNVVNSTILVISFSNKKIDKRKLKKDTTKSALLFLSENVREYQLEGWINQYAASQKLSITPQAVHLLAEYIGTDLNRIANEIKKITNATSISPIDIKQVEEYIGISKEYNSFELQKALGERNALKSNRIINSLTKDEKNNPTVLIISSLFSYFSKIIKCHTGSGMSEKELAMTLGVHPFILKEYKMAARNYNLKSCTKIISYLRSADIKSKGIEFGGRNKEDVLIELVANILLIR